MRFIHALQPVSARTYPSWCRRHGTTGAPFHPEIKYTRVLTRWSSGVSGTRLTRQSYVTCLCREQSSASDCAPCQAAQHTIAWPIWSMRVK